MVMKTSLKTILLVSLLSAASTIRSVHVLTQSHIKGAMVGAALGDAFARVVTNRSIDSDINKPILSFNDLQAEEQVCDAKECSIGIGTENTVILMSQLESLIACRQTGSTQENLIRVCTEKLTKILDYQNHSTDQFYHLRHFSPTTLEKIQLLVASNNAIGSRSSTAGDSRALVRAIPAGIVFFDSVEMVKKIADIEICLTDTHPVTRVAGIALAVGIAYAVQNCSVDEIVHQMISVAEMYEAKFGMYLQESRPSSYIRAASQEALRGTNSNKIMGLKLGSKPAKWRGYDPAEALGLVVYCFVKHNGNLFPLLHDSINTERNNELIATLSGALAGAKTGFWSLLKEGYIEEVEMIEKVNVMLTDCNEVYILASDYQPFVLSTS
jgi:ADP-ribosylglycohydrolase